VKEDEREKDNEQCDTNGDGDAEPVVTAQLGRTSFLKKWKKHKKIMLFGIKGCRCSGDEILKESILSHANKDHCNMVIQKKAADMNCIQEIHSSSLQQNISNVTRIVVTNNQF